MPKFPLSPFRQIGNTFYLSGQIGQKDGQLVSDDIGDQIVQAVANIEQILLENGLGLKNIIDVTAFIVDQDNYVTFNEVYAKSFVEPYPSRTTVTVKSLPLGASVELKVIAVKE